MKKVYLTAYFLASVLFPSWGNALNLRRVSGKTLDKAESSSINFNFDNILAESSNYVHKTSTETIHGTKIFNDHVEYKGTAPAISSCGAVPSGSAVGNDNAGIITVGGGAVTACTMTFNRPWVNTPICNVTTSTTTVTIGITAASVSAVTFGMSASLGGGTIYYSCRGYE